MLVMLTIRKLPLEKKCDCALSIGIKAFVVVVVVVVDFKRLKKYCY